MPDDGPAGIQAINTCQHCTVPAACSMQVLAPETLTHISVARAQFVLILHFVLQAALFGADFQGLAGSSSTPAILHEHAGYAFSSTAFNTVASTSARPRGNGIAGGVGKLAAAVQLATEQQHLRPTHAHAQGCMDTHHGMRTAVEMLKARILAWQTTTGVHDPWVGSQSADLSNSMLQHLHPHQRQHHQQHRYPNQLHGPEGQQQGHLRHDPLQLNAHMPQGWDPSLTDASQVQPAASQGSMPGAALSGSGSTDGQTFDRAQAGAASASDAAAELETTTGQRSDSAHACLASGNSGTGGHTQPLTHKSEGYHLHSSIVRHHQAGRTVHMSGAADCGDKGSAALPPAAAQAAPHVYRTHAACSVAHGHTCTSQNTLHLLSFTPSGVTITSTGAAGAAALDTGTPACGSGAQLRTALFADSGTAALGTAALCTAAIGNASADMQVMDLTSQAQVKSKGEEAGRNAMVPSAVSSSVCAAGSSMCAAGSSMMQGALHVTGTPLWGVGGGSHGGIVYAGKCVQQFQD